MSAKRWGLSALFVWHIIAIALGSLASPGAIPPVGPPRHPTGDVFAATLTPPLDVFAARVSRIPAVFARAAGPLQSLAATYLRGTGVSQSWKMFANPPLVHQYLRVRYYVGSRTNELRPAWTATELVLPAHREDEVRVVRGYWDAFRDKAMTSALARFHGERSNALLRADTKSAELPNHIAPIARYFARRFQRDSLTSDERVVRTEIWYGIAPMPIPGELSDARTVDKRRTVLGEYYRGPVENHLIAPSYPQYHIVEVEADIQWYLEYFEP